MANQLCDFFWEALDMKSGNLFIFPNIKSKGKPENCKFPRVLFASFICKLLGISYYNPNKVINYYNIQIRLVLILLIALTELNIFCVIGR